MKTFTAAVVLVTMMVLVAVPVAFAGDPVKVRQDCCQSVMMVPEVRTRTVYDTVTEQVQVPVTRTITEMETRTIQVPVQKQVTEMQTKTVTRQVPRQEQYEVMRAYAPVQTYCATPVTTYRTERVRPVREVVYGRKPLRTAARNTWNWLRTPKRRTVAVESYAPVYEGGYGLKK